ncbi:MAG TPA: hypothetical protein VF876_14805 [Burkholderiales bacterium]
MQIRIRRIPSVAAVALIASTMAGAAGAAGGTAKARLAEARALAAKWQPDAMLVTVSALQAKDDGTAAPGTSGWVYQFHSPKTGKWIGVHAGAKGLERQDLPAGMKTPLPQDFVDSDKALDAARNGGFKKSGDTLLVLALVADPSVKTGVYWCATGKADMISEPVLRVRSWCVDPKSGNFVARLAGGAATAASKPAPAAPGMFAIDPAKCGGFTAADAAPHLGAPAAQVKTASEKGSGDEWKCSYSAGGKTLTFTIAAAKSVKEAESRMDKYTATLKDDYTEMILNHGAEGVWSNAANALTVRRGNVIVRTLPPLAKVPQAKLANDVVGKF